MSKGIRMTNKELNELVSKREQELEALHEKYLELQNNYYINIDKSKAEGYREAIREIIDLLKEGVRAKQ